MFTERYELELLVKHVMLRLEGLPYSGHYTYAFTTGLLNGYPSESIATIIITD